MEPVAITDMKKWSSIDIFLFSNGQEYSPPRKYHLRSEQMQWWGTTMSYLGRTHYGSGHSIELYSIDGTKITSPLELSDGAAYVAVEPPDTFINTGYEEYLLKASRSWEKRLAQKSYNTETTSPDLNGSKDPNLWRNTDDINIPENTADIVSLTDDNKLTSPKKLTASKTNQRLQRKSITSSKQIQKKKSFDMNSAILKRTCTNIDKTVPCPKKTPQKKYECLNRKLLSNIVTRKLNGTTNQDKRVCVKPKQNSNIEASKNVNIYGTDPVRDSEIIDLFSKGENDLISLKCDLQNILLNGNSIHQNQNNLTVDDVPELNRNSTEIENNQDLVKHSLIKSNEINEFKRNDKLSINDLQEIETETGGKDIPMLDNCNKSKTRDDDNLKYNSEKQVIDEYVARMNGGGLLLLKLKIKLKDCKSIVNRDQSKNTPMTIPLSNLPQTEKTSQVDINISFSGELLKSDDQQYSQNKSLQSLLNKFYIQDGEHIRTKNPKIIILQCACHDYSDKRKYCMCDTLLSNDVRGNKLEITSNQQLNKTFTGCDCGDESVGAKEYNQNNDLISQSANRPNKDRPSLSKANSTRVKDLAQKFESSDGIKPKEKKNFFNNKLISDNILTDEDHRQSIVSTKFNESVSESENRFADDNNDPNSKNICNKSTQTDWCNVLLEARRHGNDDYTFHLPSLYVLKQYNI